MTRILVVDDEQSMRDFLAIFLRKEGHEVRLAEDGPKALSLLAAEEIDLVLSDVRMSQMDGIRLLREVKKPLSERRVHRHDRLLLHRRRHRRDEGRGL